MKDSKSPPASTPADTVVQEHGSQPTPMQHRAAGEGAACGSERFGYVYHRILLVADGVALLAACAVALTVALLVDAGADSTRWAATVLVASPAWILIAYQFGLYGQVERRFKFDYVTELVPAVTALTVWCWFVALLGGVMAAGGPNLFGSAVLWLAAIPSVLFCRAVARAFAGSRSWFSRSVALIGDDAAVRRVNQRIERHPEWGISVDLVLSRDDGSGEWELTGSRAQPHGPAEGLDEYDVTPIGVTRLVRDRCIDRVIVAGGTGPLEARTALLHTLLDRGVSVDYVAGGPENLFAGSTAQHLEGMTLMSARPSHPGPLDRAIKRGVDVVLSSTLLILTAPLFALAAIRIKRDSDGPVFFRQVRSGLNEKPFEVIKLRTMYVGAHSEREALRRETAPQGNDDVLFKLDDDPRVTRAGQWLRRTSLDELPQLWNVLRGDMSMVGPRPLVPEEAEMAHGMYLARFRVTPGIAGPWQAEGRSEIPFEDMLKLDYSYVAGWSMAEDVKLLLRTFSAVVGRKGAK
ncbi:MAG: sugar transferase [Actinomycetota bacterium]|nr:sugar transferase [Actinomycetota bacterium]